MLKSLNVKRYLTYFYVNKQQQQTELTLREIIKILLTIMKK